MIMDKSGWALLIGYHERRSFAEIDEDIMISTRHPEEPRSSVYIGDRNWVRWTSYKVQVVSFQKLEAVSRLFC